MDCSTPGFPAQHLLLEFTQLMSIESVVPSNHLILCQSLVLLITFLPRTKRLFISWLHSPPAVILEPKNIKHVTVSIVSPSVCHEVMGPDAMIFVVEMLSFKPAFPLSSFTFIKRFFGSCSLSASKSGLSLGMQPVLFITWKIRGGNYCNLYFLFLFYFIF